jgi:peptidoglycan/LPS O-acetylase OafA/YrhL
VLIRSGDLHFPGFDGLRLLAALSVLFSHSFLIATGTESDEPLVRLLGPGNIIGLYGVYTFFIISGFLLARSLAQDPSPVRFAINRTLRIYPGFIFCILVTALLLGPIGSSLAWREYSGSPGVFAYVTTALSCLCDTTLPGVYAYEEAGNLRTVVNGSLWSLSFEVLSYLLLVCFWLALRNTGAVAVALALLAAAAMAFPAVYASIPGVTYTLPYFAGGVLMHSVQQHFGLKARVAALCAMGFVICAVFGLQRHAYAIFGAYLVVFFGNRPNLGSVFAARVGDVSYGVYLFGWPVEQLVKQYTHTTSPWLLMSLACPIVLAVASVSFHLVERPTLRLKTPLTMLARRALTIDDPVKRRAALPAATLAFLAVAAAILMSEKHWWYVTRSLGAVVLSSAVGAAAALAAVRAARAWRQRKRA